MFQTCVIREVKGIQQYVPVSEVPVLRNDEPVFSGEFTSEAVKDGPSNSHTRTICLPTGRITRSLPCVLRDISVERIGDFQYVPVDEVPAVERGERIFFGAFAGEREKCGPYGSHERTICRPVGQLVERVAA
jgi:hypothetical protein